MQVLDAPPNAAVDSWWTDGTCDRGTYGGSWENQYVYTRASQDDASPPISRPASQSAS